MVSDTTLRRDCWLILVMLCCLVKPQTMDSQVQAVVEKTQERDAKPQEKSPAYVLGPGDQIVMQALEAEEISNKPVRIDSAGFITLPLVGKVRAAGLSTTELEAEVTTHLKTYIQAPQVAISVTEFRSQPVTIIGAVTNPGIHQLQGQKTLVEMLAMAGGVRADAGYVARITRRREWGLLPLTAAKVDAAGEFRIADVNLAAVMDAANPQENILLKPYDIISIPRADLVHVIGAVRKAGGFVLRDQETVSVLQAIAFAEGLGATAAPQNAKILRAVPNAKPVEVPVDIKKILAGKSADVPLGPDDILFIPENTAKKVLHRTIETAVGIGTGLVIYRR
jgi:polysaccharide export outer membrane protein